MLLRVACFSAVATQAFSRACHRLHISVWNSFFANTALLLAVGMMGPLLYNILGILAPVVQRPDNFIEWISHYPTVSICAKISVFPRVQVNMHTLTTAKFGSV